MINRKELVQRHNPKLTYIDLESPMTVGNGECAFTADVTGFQSLYNEYSNANAPLCTMSNWGWHTEPAKGTNKTYSLNNIDMTHYKCGEKILQYAVECKPGNEEVYRWLRHNPHRLNLAKISLIWNNKDICSESLSDISQELDLYTGVLHSNYKIHSSSVSVQTVFAQSSDVAGFFVQSGALNNGQLKIKISFPYGSYRINASSWENEALHKTTMYQKHHKYENYSIVKTAGSRMSGSRARASLRGFGGRAPKVLIFKGFSNIKRDVSLVRTLDNERYYVDVTGNADICQSGVHEFVVHAKGDTLFFTVAFSCEKQKRRWSFDEVCKDSVNSWERFWLNGGAVDFSRSKDPRAKELERRTVLSQYLTAVHSSGSIPPQETGLACNSWYGKFHLEMHIFHSGSFPLWNRSNLLEKSFDWYLKILNRAKENAARNGYKGARWPKMTGPEGIDSPSRIATLLIWQQPHILYMLELVRNTKPISEQTEFMDRYWCIVSETADFMSDFVKFNRETNEYDLIAPLIPAQEEHMPETTVNPAFELCYWHFGLTLAAKRAKLIGKDCSEWETVLEKLASPHIFNGLYVAHKNCPDTFELFNRDHPSMLFGYGFIPCEKVDEKIMSDTSNKVIECWDFSTSWGWDFALMAMTLTRLGRPEAAVDILLMDTYKNSYVASGNNYQRSRSDLPLYLPGNGSLLLALSMMIAGYGENRDMPGFPKNGMWDIEFEGISPLPY